MKLFKEKILSDDLFVLKEERFPYNDFPLHIHPEYELILVMKSHGRRYVGDNISSFSPGDLCLFGPNLPHTFYNKHLPADREVHQIVIQFEEGFLGEGFFDKVRFKGVKELFLRAAKGICFAGETRNTVAVKMKEMLQANDLEAVSLLLSILNLLSVSKDYQLLSGNYLSADHIEKDTERMSRVYHYLLNNFRNQITLEEIAGVASLTTAAFCRYFKKHTRKTFSEMVNELRIGHACKLLQLKEMSVLEVCYESGFNNISYFNRQFRLLMDRTPLQYRKGQ